MSVVLLIVGVLVIRMLIRAGFKLVGAAIWLWVAALMLGLWFVATATVFVR